jgi:hypothetical protein
VASQGKIGRAPTAEAQERIDASIIVIDQAPLRRAAASECNEAMACLDEARAAWHRYEREDKPSFARWRAREFGPLLSEARDVELKVREHETLMHEVEMEMRRGFIDPHTAYRRVMARRKDPNAVVEESKTARNDAGRGRAVSEFEKEALFQEWVQKSLGTNPDKMDDAAYTASFEAFKAHMFRARPDEPSVNTTRRATSSIPVEVEEEPAEAPVDARVKELYRLLVRRLHPDLRADGSASVSALWHEVQEAYAATDIPQLEILLALSELTGEEIGEQTSVGQMRAVLAELERSLGALEQSLREARREDAWDFARSGAVEGLRERVERELRANLRRRTERLRILTRTIAAWSRPPIGNAGGAVELYPEIAV